MYIGLHVKYPLFLPDFNKNGIFSTDFRKNTQTSNFMNIRPVEQSCSMRTNGQTDSQRDVTKLIVALRNFAIAPKNCKLILYFKWQAVYKFERSPFSYSSAHTGTRDYGFIYFFSNVFYATLNVHYRIHNSSSQNYTLNPVNTTSYTVSLRSVLILPAYSISFK